MKDLLSQNLNQLKGFRENRVTVVADKLDIFPQKETDWCRQPAGAPRTQITTIYQTRRHYLGKKVKSDEFSEMFQTASDPLPPHFRKIIWQILYPDNHFLPSETPLSGRKKKVTTTRPHNHVPVSNQLDSNLKYIFEGFSPELFLGVARYMWKTQEKIGA